MYQIGNQKEPGGDELNDPEMADSKDQSPRKDLRAVRVALEWKRSACAAVVALMIFAAVWSWPTLQTSGSAVSGQELEELDASGSAISSAETRTFADFEDYILRMRLVAALLTQERSQDAKADAKQLDQASHRRLATDEADTQNTQGAQGLANPVMVSAETGSYAGAAVHQGQVGNWTFNRISLCINAVETCAQNIIHIGLNANAMSKTTVCNPKKWRSSDGKLLGNPVVCAANAVDTVAQVARLAADLAIATQLCVPWVADRYHYSCIVDSFLNTQSNFLLASNSIMADVDCRHHKEVNITIGNTSATATLDRHGNLDGGSYGINGPATKNRFPITLEESRKNPGNMNGNMITMEESLLESRRLATLPGLPPEVRIRRALKQFTTNANHTKNDTLIQGITNNDALQQDLTRCTSAAIALVSQVGSFSMNFWLWAENCKHLNLEEHDIAHRNTCVLYITQNVRTLATVANQASQIASSCPKHPAKWGACSADSSNIAQAIIDMPSFGLAVQRDCQPFDSPFKSAPTVGRRLEETFI